MRFYKPNNYSQVLKSIRTHAEEGDRFEFSEQLVGFDVLHWRGFTLLEKCLTLQESFEFGAVDVYVADELDVVDVHRVF